MADVFFGADRGDRTEDVVTQATTPAKDVEIAYDAAVSLTKQEVLQLIDVIKERILRDDDL